MKYLNLQKTFVDGRTLSYHKVYELKVLPDTFEVKLGSYYSLNNLMTSGTPDFISNILIPKTSDINSLLEQVILLPDWQGGDLVDLSKPEPLPVTEEDV
jgi:hypothetical protein